MSDLIVGDSQKSEIWNRTKSHHWRFSKAALIRFLLASLIALFWAFLSIWPRFLFTLCWMFLGPAIWIDGFANFDIFHLVHPLQHALPRLPQQLLHRLGLPLLPESSLKPLLQLLLLLFNVVFQSEIFTLSNLFRLFFSDLFCATFVFSFVMSSFLCSILKYFALFFVFVWIWIKF